MKTAALTLLLGMCPLLPTSAVSQSRTGTLASLRDQQRVLLVFANGNNQQAEKQLTIAAAHAAGFRERDLVLAGISGTDAAVPTILLPPQDDTAARKRFHVHPGEFTVLLLGKDGGEKLRSHDPLSWETLQSTIDAMPMRQSEMHK